MKKGLLYIVLTFILSVVNATAGAQSMRNPDSIQISLLTCSPGKEVWAQYGHTAIRYYDKESGEDLAINYGIFSLDQTYFIPRFVLGMTDYRMGVQPMDMFLAQYSYEGRGVVEQVLNLSAEDKEVIYKALQENMKPENVVYRYNYFFDNCTTRARDMLVNHLHGKVVYPPAEEDATFRSMIHKWNNKYEWSQFGEDLLLGVDADRKTTKAEQQFLPDNLRKDFEKAESEIEKVEIKQELTGDNCPECGSPLVYKLGKFGKFIACSNFPECRYTNTIQKKVGVVCPKCKKHEILEKKSKKGKLFYGCEGFPNCDFVSWDKPINRQCPKCNHLLYEGKKGVMCRNCD